MLLEPPNEAPAKAGFGGAVLHLLLGKHNRSRVKAVLHGSRFEPRGSTGQYWRVHACPRESLRVHLEGGSTRVPRVHCNDFALRGVARIQRGSLAAQRSHVVCVVRATRLHTALCESIFWKRCGPIVWRGSTRVLEEARERV